MHCEQMPAGQLLVQQHAAQQLQPAAPAASWLCRCNGEANQPALELI